MTTRNPANTKTKLLESALYVIRAQGYTATSVDDICKHAGVTKGGFFHHFKSKEDLALAAAEFFGEMAGSLFAGAPYHQIDDPLERLLGYIDFRIQIMQGELPEFTCLLGTMVQEAYDAHPAIREACNQGISAHAAEVAKDIELAKRLYTPQATWDSESLALFTQAVIQGSFILAKAKNGPEVAVDSLKHLRNYIELLFSNTRKKGKKHD